MLAVGQREVIGLSRRIYVGDIQGCRIELSRLLDELRFDPATDALEPVGDLVNRGPDSLGTLRLLMSVDAGGVLGNHDVHLLRVAAGLRRPRRSDTLGDVLSAPDRDELLRWLAARPFAKASARELLVHAGLHPGWSDPVSILSGADPLTSSPEIEFATLVRYCDDEGRRPQRGGEPTAGRYRPWFEHWIGRERRTIVFGHWAQRGLVTEPGIRGLDTGCVWGGRLTAWIAEEDRLVQVPAERAYATVG
jgi:bis(5'-nucleosyl)-tetraphosphatase (symmetrical)